MGKILNKLSVGDVVEVNLDPTLGHEQKKTRPCVVMTVHPRLDLITVFPISDAAGKSGKIFIRIQDLKAAGLKKDSIIDTYQIRTLSKLRVNKRMGAISPSELFECRKNLALIFEIEEEHLN